MSDPTATFKLNLEDRTSGAAFQAANALKSLRDKIDADTKALREMENAFKRMNAGAVVNIATAQALRDKIAAQKSAVAAATSKYVELGGTFNRIKNPAGKAKSAFDELTSSASGLPGPLGSAASSLGRLKSLLAGGAIAGGILAIVAASALLVVGTLAATAALLRYGIAQSDARRSEQLRLEGLTTMRNRYGLVAGNAAEMQRSIDRVSSSTALGRGEITRYTEQLYRMGMRGENLNQALEATAIAASVQGERGAARVMGMSAAFARTGRSVRAVADDVRARLGGVASRQMLSLSVITEKLHENLSMIFSGLHLEGFLGALRGVTELFSQNTASGRALKAIFEALFQPILGALGEAGPLARRFFQGMVLAAQEVTLIVLRTGLALKRAFAGSDLLRGLDLQRTALLAGRVAIGLFMGALTVALGVVVLVGAALAAVAATAVALAAPFILAGAAVVAVYMAGRRLVDWFSSVDWSGIGRSLVDGLVGGIRRGATAVVSAVRGLASSARSALTHALGIASPSRVFAQLGVQVPRGFAQGVERESPSVDHAVRHMVSLPSDASSTPSVAAPSQARTAVSIGDVHVHIGRDDDRSASGLAHAFRAELERVLEGLQVEMGARTT